MHPASMVKKVGDCLTMASSLREKQKLRRIYGMLERQFRNNYELADRQRGITARTCCNCWNAGWTRFHIVWVLVHRVQRHVRSSVITQFL